jgi:putative endonuclease
MQMNTLSGVDKPYQVYVLQNRNGQLYIGISENVLIRLKQHNNGVSKWTSVRGPWSLIWTSAPMPLSEALKLEIRLKKQKGGAGFFALTGLKKSTAIETIEPSH